MTNSEVASGTYGFSIGTGQESIRHWQYVTCPNCSQPVRMNVYTHSLRGITTLKCEADPEIHYCEPVNHEA